MNGVVHGLGWGGGGEFKNSKCSNLPPSPRKSLFTPLDTGSLKDWPQNVIRITYDI